METVNKMLGDTMEMVNKMSGGTMETVNEMLGKLKNGIRSIAFMCRLKGQGIVNFDSEEQRHIHNAFMRDPNWDRSNSIFGGYMNTSNFIPAKRFWNKDGEHGLKISSECVKNGMYVGNNLRDTSVTNDKILFNKKIGHPEQQLCGYLATSNQTMEGMTLKKSGAVVIVDALQINNAKSTMEVHNRAGAKKEMGDENDTKDTSFYYKESAGEVEYLLRGYINIDQLQFLSMDDRYDRMACLVDHYSEFLKPVLEKHLGSKVSDVGYYTKEATSCEVPEIGILFNDEHICTFVNYFFSKLLGLVISRSCAFVEMVSVDVKAFDNAISAGGKFFRRDSNQGWANIIVSDGKFEPLSFKSHKFYNLVPDDEARETIDRLNKNKDILIARNRARKKEIIDQRKAKKAKKEAEKNMVANDLNNNKPQ